MLIRHNDLDTIDHILSPYKLRLLAEGDSWMDIGGWFNGSLLSQISESRPDWLIVTCAQAGDTARNMAAVAESGDYSWMLRKNDGVPLWDALLLSAGGNDLIGHIARFVDADGVLDDELEAGIAEFEQHYMALINIARRAQPGIPVVMHTYDYIQPRAKKQFLRPGPWVGAQFKTLGMHPYFWPETSNIVIDSLGACVDRIARRASGVHVVHSAGRLTPSPPGWMSDWANEIHPSAKGYRKLAPLWCSAIERATKGAAA